MRCFSPSGKESHLEMNFTKYRSHNWILKIQLLFWGMHSSGNLWYEWRCVHALTSLLWDVFEKFYLIFTHYWKQNLLFTLNSANILQNTFLRTAACILLMYQSQIRCVFTKFRYKTHFFKHSFNWFRKLTLFRFKHRVRQPNFTYTSTHTS